MRTAIFDNIFGVRISSSNEYISVVSPSKLPPISKTTTKNKKKEIRIKLKIFFLYI